MDLIPSAESGLFGGFPRVDIRETAKDVVVVADISGFNPKQVKVEVSETSLKISAQGKSEKEVKDKNFYSKEQRSHSFQRVISLPCSVKREGVSAVTKDGTLTVTLPKKFPDEHKMKKIPLEEA